MPRFLFNNRLIQFLTHSFTRKKLWDCFFKLCQNFFSRNYYFKL